MTIKQASGMAALLLALSFEPISAQATADGPYQSPKNSAPDQGAPEFRCGNSAPAPENQSRSFYCPECDLSPKGDCDLPEYRNHFLPHEEDPILIVRLFVQIAHDTTAEPDVPDFLELRRTAEDLQVQMQQLNSDFADVRIHFVWEAEFTGEILPHFDPEHQLNITVQHLDPNGIGTFPWTPEVLGPEGGLRIDPIAFGYFVHWDGYNREWRFNYYAPVNRTLAHEVGHCLGLYHTFEPIGGWSNCNPSPECFEQADLLGPDRTGDFCSDTDLPLQTGTGPHCTGSNYYNFMDYRPFEYCAGFTPQQIARMRCWTLDRLSSWIERILPSSLFVNCTWNGIERGTQQEPFQTLGSAISAIPSDLTMDSPMPIYIESTGFHCPGGITIDRNVNIYALGGTVRIGS